MMKYYRYLFVNVLIIGFSVMLTMGQSTNPEQAELKIGLHNSPPFIMDSGDGLYTGLSIDLWEPIALKTGIGFKYVLYDDLGQLIDAIDNEEVDLSISPLTVTSERLKRFSFSQPFFISNMAIAARASESGPVVSFLKKFFSKQFFEVVILLFFIIFIFGFILWFVERKKNTEHFGKGLRGIGDGIWWSAVTMTTVGYGDKAPKTGLGRVISIVWMFTAVVIISGFTASISAALTYNKIQSSISTIDDLRGISVGTVENSSSAEFLLDRKINFTEFVSLEMALENLNDGRITAVIYDKPLLTYLIDTKGYHKNADVISSGVGSVYYSFTSKNDSLLKVLNPVLIELIESRDWERILNKYNLHEN